MTKLQKDFIKSIVKAVGTILLMVLFFFGFYIFAKALEKGNDIANAIFCLIVVIAAATVIFFVLYGIVYLLTREYKVRGILTEEEFKLYNTRTTDQLLTFGDRENEMLEEIEQKLRDNGIKRL